MEETKKLLKTITEGIQEKKGRDITIVDLSKIDGTICHYFVICCGGSPTQVEAIAEEIGLQARQKCGEKPTHVEGLQNAQWVAMDYVDIIVHVFLPEVREFYNLEELWEDAKVTHIKNEDE